MENSTNGFGDSQHKMKGTFQGQDEIIIDAPAEAVWNALIDGSLLSKWMKIVKHTTSEVECLNAIRSCDVEMNGKMGKVQEKCVLFNPLKQIGWKMEQDTFGFSRMFNNYGFSFELKPLSTAKTLVVNKGFYDPRNLFVSILNRLVMKSKSSAIRKSALAGLKEVIENRIRIST